MTRTAVQMRCAGVGDVEQGLVRGKCQAVRLDEIGGRPDRSCLCRIMPVDVAAADFLLAIVALIVVQDAVGRIGEPDRSRRT